ncbi:MAG: TonB-dependent receptor [Alphaproteobacteria bacterium]|jgi:vitamin B12 transporter|nr:TonB-dependent receptor [Alphaproteobacteria bacterium]
MTTRHLLGTVAALGLMANGATAQQIINLEEVTFSANLTETELSRAGASVTVLTQEDLEATNSTQLADALRLVSGVTVRRTGGFGGSTDVSIRGAGGEYVPVYIDGVLVTDPTELKTRFNFASLSTADIERVEILRGGQSAIYGSSAIGGVISITTTRAEVDGTTQSASIEGGSYGTVDLRYSLRHRVGDFEFGIALSRFHTDGFSSIQPLGGPRFAPDAFDSTQGNLYAEYDVTDQLTIGVAVARTDSDAEYDDAFSNADANNLLVRRNEHARLYAQYSAGAFSHDLSLSFFRTTRQFVEAFRNDAYEGIRRSLKYVGTYDASSALKLSFGAEISEEQFGSESGTPVVIKTEELLKRAVFAELDWQPSDALNVTFSARLDHDANVGITPSARVAASYQVSPDLRVRGVLSNGFRAPTMEERFADYDFRRSFPYYFKGNPNLRPEEALSAEIGFDWQATDDFALSTTGFYTKLTDAIRGCGAFEIKATCGFPLPPGVNASYENVDEIVRRGVEINADWTLSDRNRIAVNYTGIDAKITSGPAAGSRLGSVPRHSGSVLWESQINDRLTVAPSILFAAGRIDGDGGPKMPSYGIANLNVSYSLTDSASLMFRVDNLFDKEYQEVADFGTSGRAFYLGLSSRF